MSKAPIILASGSRARRDMLKNADIVFQKHSADIDEYKLIDNLQSKNVAHEDIAIKLSQEKALAVSSKYKDSYIIGSDQLLIFNNQVFSKSNNLEQAKEKLKTLSGKKHTLISGVSVVLNGEVKWSFSDEVHLQMHNLMDNEIDDYIKVNQDICLSCVGGYAIEGAGIKLFHAVEGDFFTIMGMPLLPLLNYLKREGAA